MAKVTRTTNPLPFEVLEPHKFEDVVRGLLYDFRDWQIIEPTGKGGADDGYDARGWEKVRIIENEDEEDKSKGEHPMEGNRWMIQCKREKIITPKKLEKILDDINSKDPPYGYILAAACDFSKKTQDTFRENLLKKGVTEFYLWGKSHLEDMLYLPKNDHILFTTFGISLNTRRRSRKTEIRFALNNKNKIFRIWGDAQSQSLKYDSVLIRDFDDEKYPYKSEYKDFGENPRWIECIPFRYHPLGIWVHYKKYHGYIDSKKKQLDYFKEVDLLNYRSERFDAMEKNRELRNNVTDFWERLPIKNQAEFSIDGLIYFKDILLIDDKGDPLYDFPHIFVEFNKHKKLPFSSYHNLFKTNTEEVEPEENFKRIEIFPKKITKQKLGRVLKNKLDIPYSTIGIFRGGVSQNGTIYDLENKYKYLKKGEIVTVTDDTERTGQSEERYLEVTQIYEVDAKDAPNRINNSPFEQPLDQQPQKKIKKGNKMNVIEVRSISKWEIEAGKK